MRQVKSDLSIEETAIEMKRIIMKYVPFSLTGSTVNWHSEDVANLAIYIDSFGKMLGITR